MQTAGLITIAFGFMIASGGVMGYVRAKSFYSILTGGLSGIVLMVAGQGMRGGRKWALPTTYGITLALLLFFATKYLHTHKMMPAGSTIMLCIVELILLAVTAKRA